MQTFLPYQSFIKSARCLDRQRLGKQRVEAMQIYRTLTGQPTGWRNHPAVKMWANDVVALRFYYNVICREWERRGYTHNMGYLETELFEHPEWITPEFCLSHQSNLIRKYPEHYRPIFGEDVPDDLPYVWPIGG